MDRKTIKAINCMNKMGSAIITCMENEKERIENQLIDRGVIYTEINNGFIIYKKGENN